MSTIVKGLKNTEKKSHDFKDYICFIDSEKNVFIIGGEDAIIDISSSFFNQYQADYYSDIEDFFYWQNLKLHY